MTNRGNILELKNLLNRYEMYKQIFTTKNEEKYLIVGFNELLNVFEKNVNLVKINSEIKDRFNFNENINLFWIMKNKHFKTILN